MSFLVLLIISFSLIWPSCDVIQQGRHDVWPSLHDAHAFFYHDDPLLFYDALFCALLFCDVLFSFENVLLNIKP